MNRVFRPRTLLRWALLSSFLAVGAWLSQAVQAAPSPATQKSFKTPDAAVVALLKAVQERDKHSLLAVLGPASQDILSSGDPVMDRTNRQAFIRKVNEKAQLVKLEPTSMGLRIGKDGWLFPVPIVKSGNLWAFDSVAGRREVLGRRIGHNELSIIDLCHAFVDAQREYQAKARTGKGREYAQKFRSTPGKKDGLYWPVPAGQPGSPLGPLVATATHEGYDSTKRPAQPVPFHGYYFRVLTGQGPHAAGGAQSYLVDGHMTRGFAMVAWPAKYRNSGVMTFMVNQTGIVFEKDLGPTTDVQARATKTFDPDSTWKPSRKP